MRTDRPRAPSARGGRGLRNCIVVHSCHSERENGKREGKGRVTAQASGGRDGLGSSAVAASTAGRAVGLLTLGSRREHQRPASHSSTARPSWPGHEHHSQQVSRAVRPSSPSNDFSAHSVLPAHSLAHAQQRHQLKHKYETVGDYYPGLPHQNDSARPPRGPHVLEDGDKDVCPKA